MKNYKITTSILLVINLLLVPTAQAAEMLIFENDDTRPFTARNLIIDNQDKGGNLTLQFGRTLSEQFFWDNANSRFKLTDDFDVQGTLSGSAVHAGGGNVTIDTNGATIFNVNENAVNFRIATDNQSNMFFVDGTNNRIGIGTSSPEVDLELVGTASGLHLHAQDTLTSSGTFITEGAATFGSTVSLGGVTYTFPGSDGSSGYTLKTNGAGTLSWTADSGGISQGEADDRYVNISGDNMSGNLVISNAATLSVSGAIRTEDNLTINDDNGAADAVLTFGNDAGAETLTFSDTNNRFDFSDDVHSTGNVTASGTITVDGAAVFGSTITLGGVAYTFPVGDGSASGKVLATDSAGQLVWTDRDVVNQDTFDERYVNVAGDTMTGNLVISNSGTLSVSGAIRTESNLTINDDNGAVDAVLTFGNDAGAETLTFSDTNNRFDFSDDIHTTGNATASGTLTVEGNATLKSTLTIGGIAYTFPGSDGSSGYTLKTNGAGTLSWTPDSGGISQDAADDRYVNIGGDNMTGNLVISNSGTLSVSGAIRTESNLTINDDNGAADAIITFGNNITPETLLFGYNTQRFEFSDDVHTTGNVTASGTITVDGAAVFGSTITLGGVAYTFPVGDGSASGKVLATDSAGQLVWTDRDLVNESAFDDRYVNISGDTMTGNLVISDAATLSVSGAVRTEGNLTINDDNGAADAVLTFGNDAGAETLTFSDTNNRFDFSDDVHTTGNVTASGTITVDGAAVFGSTITLGGVAYTFPVGDGSASGKVLATDSAGQLVWTDRDVVNQDTFDERYVNVGW